MRTLRLIIIFLTGSHTHGTFIDYVKDLKVSHCVTSKSKNLNCFLYKLRYVKWLENYETDYSE